MKKLLLTSAAALALATVAVSTTKVEAFSRGHVIEHTVNDTKSLSAARWGSRLHILNLLTRYKDKLGEDGFRYYNRQFRAKVGRAKSADAIDKLYDEFEKELEEKFGQD
ncbi:hypothetical protein [Streptococcus equi]|uniref:hypothetical protein n=1 Tax=Streptococcus equi TaxID=1336 RepID=UPI000E04BE2E|nr:hypothetical protein [Streptococcus equi]HEL1015249.1 hypothetical protein [Streptococcus equi subsp. ruminatorum]MCD3383070.1 hypothetical protein [Streptococcus equi subsp. zooepidemicus]MCD3415852.1 hypothetical protein [Streptococcus equi subsp. zooepidemicus]MCD3419000.1 hypothetical protein [Streptococcus equi subsp. zooepidemicus]MCD3424860.1 hypothetical protein [Streptococcus equi subsp. zooepidemicus]